MPSGRARSLSGGLLTFRVFILVSVALHSDGYAPYPNGKGSSRLDVGYACVIVVVQSLVAGARREKVDLVDQ